ncbi:hypothetical protein VTO73DRAFT_6188 [Trametes versicolor]
MNNPHLLSIPPELVVEIADMCDLPSLLALRLTSSYLGKHVHSVLQSDLAALLRHYVDVPDALLGHMSTTGALIGGLAALSFLLRDRSMRPPSLDIFVALQEAEYLEILLGRDVTRGMQLVSTVDYDALNPDNTPPQTSRVVTYLCVSGRLLTIHKSTSPSALDPIALSPTTALINWVSPHAFGCGYPELSLNRRAIASPGPPAYPANGAVFVHLDNHGFDTQLSPWFWSRYEELVMPSDRRCYRPCLRRLYMCPGQGRYFGDAGTLLNVFDLHGTDHAVMRSKRQLPYGVSLVWRLPFGGGPCDCCCGRIDEFRNFVCSSGPWFSICMIPRRTTWEVMDNNHLTTVLSFMGKPLTIWVVGHLVSLNLHIASNSDAPLLRLCTRLLSNQDRLGVADLERTVHPDHRTPSDQLFRAISKKGDSGRAVLSSVYDATSTYRRKDEMCSMEITRLRPQDVVLVECLFVRKQLLGDWQTWFEIGAVAQITAAEDAVDTRVERPQPLFPSVI